MITVDYVLKRLAREAQKPKYMHKTRYGRALDQKWGYDKRSHQEDYKRLKDKPFDPLLWYK